MWELFFLFFSFRDLSVGRGSTASVAGGVLPMVHPVEAWDGMDGVVSGCVNTDSV